MAVCINKNSIEYQSLKDRAGISEFILEAVCRDFLEKYNRFPHLDELPNSNSEQSLRNTFKIKENNGVKISNLLEITGKETIEEATIDINNQYRDLEVKILPIVEEAIVDVVHRPTENNFNNLSEEDQILSKAPRDSEGYLLAPNGKRSNLTEKQYAQVRTKNFINWFGDWINNPSEASKVVDKNGEPLVVYHYTDNDNLTEFSIDFDNYFAQHGGTKKAIFFTRDNVIPGSENNFLTSRKHKLSLFLNIRNITEYRGTKEDLHKKGTTYVQVINESAQKNDIDGGLVFKGLDDNRKLDQTIYVVHNPKQTKSAISNEGSFSKINNNIYDEVPNSYLVLNNALQKLASLYGITFNEVTDAELNSDQWAGLIQDVQSVNAFVYNGQIYINTDRANIDAPIHEMFHILVGSMRFENPELYQNLINSVENLYNYSILISQYPGRSRNDINEEIFITELAKYFSGLPSELINLDQKTMYELTYNIKRTLDTILMGEDSVKTISDERLYNMSLKEVIDEVNSTIATSNFHGFINIEGSELHRKLNNIKSDLLRNKTLEEICD